MIAAGWIVLLALLQLGDYYTTRYVVEAMRGREVNPVMLLFMRAMGFRSALIAKGVIVVLICYRFQQYAAPACVPFALAVANNLFQIYRFRKVS